jgi:hypothetical protein
LGSQIHDGKRRGRLVRAGGDPPPGTSAHGSADRRWLEVEATQVAAIEDSLTKLEATAVNDEGRTQARTLRDAVRAARTRLAALDTAENTMVALSLLQSGATGLETALTSVGRSAQPSKAETTPR